MTAAAWGAVAAATVVLLCVSAKTAAAAWSRSTAAARASQLRPHRAGGVVPGWGCVAAAAVAVTCVAGAAYGPVIALVVVVLEVAATFAVRAYGEQRRARAYERAIPLSLDEMARSMRSGAGLLIAIEEAAGRSAAGVGGDLRQVVREINMGIPMDDALERWKDRKALPSVRLCVAALTLALETGGARAQAVDAVAATLRQSLNAVDLAATRATEAKVSALALTALPVVITAPLLMFNADARHFMLATWVGQAVLVTGLALDGLGAWLMTRMIRQAVA